MKASIADVLSRLPSARKSGPNQWMALCPAHDDSTPSLSIKLAADGEVLLYCHAGCSFDDIVRAIGMPLQRGSDGHQQRPVERTTLQPQRKVAPPEHAVVWTYRFADGTEAFRVYRWNQNGAKTVRPFHLANGQLVPGIPEMDTRPVLNLPQILAAPQDQIIYVVEGEKCVDALERIGLLATTSSSGAKAAKKSDWSWARNRRIVILPDNDDPGCDYANEVAMYCRQAGAESVTVIDPSVYGLPPGGDVADLPSITPDTIQGWIASARAGQSQNNISASDTANKRSSSLDDKEAASMFAGQHAELLWCGGEWWTYSNGWWRSVEEETVKRMVVEFLEALNDGRKVSTSRMNSVTEMLRVIRHKSIDVLVAGSRYIALKNCTFDTQELEFIDHDAAHFCTRSLPIEFVPDHVPAPNWEAFLLQAFSQYGHRAVEVAAMIQEFAGYCLWSSTELERALWIYGPPGTGKSTLLHGIRSIFGDSVTSIGLADIESSRFALGTLIGKSIMISTEQPGDFVRSSHVLNALISGEEIQVERKFKDPITFRPHAKLIWAMNELPRIQNINDGLYRRLIIVQMGRQPANPDTKLKQKIEQEAQGIFHWAVAGLERIQQRGEIKVPDCVRDQLLAYKASNDIVSQFIEEKCVLDADGIVRSAELYDAYAEWCKANGHRPKSSTAIAEDWRRIGLQQVRGSHWRGWKGIRLVTATDAYDPGQGQSQLDVIAG